MITRGSSQVVSVDPGKHKVAWATWDPETGKLTGAGLVIHKPEIGTERVQVWKEVAYWTDVATGLSSGSEIRLVVEVPQIYTGVRDEDPNDLIDLAGVVGAIASTIAIGSVEWSPLPREWKGQIPKEVTQKRVDKRLSPEEKALIKWPIKSLCHNVYDAIHLGIVYLEREGLRAIPEGQKFVKES